MEGLRRRAEAHPADRRDGSVDRRGGSAGDAGRAHPGAAAGMAHHQQGARGRKHRGGGTVRTGVHRGVPALPGPLRRAGRDPPDESRCTQASARAGAGVRGRPTCGTTRPSVDHARAARSAAGVAQPLARRSRCEPPARCAVLRHAGSPPRQGQRLACTQHRRQAGADRGRAAADDGDGHLARHRRSEATAGTVEGDRPRAACAVPASVGRVPRAVQRRVRAPTAGVRAAGRNSRAGEGSSRSPVRTDRTGVPGGP